MDYVAEEYKRMKSDVAIEVNTVADKFIAGLYEHAESEQLSEDEQKQIYKFIRRKILNGSFRNKRERDITLTIFDKLKEIFTV